MCLVDGFRMGGFGVSLVRFRQRQIFAQSRAAFLHIPSQIRQTIIIHTLVRLEHPHDFVVNDLKALEVFIDLRKETSSSLAGRLGVVLHTIQGAIVFIHRAVVFAGLRAGIANLGSRYDCDSEDGEQHTKKNCRALSKLSPVAHDIPPSCSCCKRLAPRQYSPLAQRGTRSSFNSYSGTAVFFGFSRRAFPALKASINSSSCLFTTLRTASSVITGTPLSVFAKGTEA